MQLSIPTLQFTDCIVFASCGTIFVCNWLLHRERTYSLSFGISFLVCAVMSVWFVDFGFYGSVWSPLGWSMAGMTFWIGLRLFDGRSAMTPFMLVFAVIPTGVHVVLSLSGFGPEAVNAGSTLAYAAHETAVAHYVLSTARRNPMRRLIGLSLLTIAVAICLPLVAITEEQTRLTVVAIFIVDHVSTIVLTTCILALEADRAYARLARTARTDMLTGLLNRAGLAFEARRCIHEGAVIVADLDHFKSINDRHGHAGGDEVLREFAHRLSEVAPKEAHVARLGGEEFCVVLPGYDQGAAAFVAERLRRAVGSLGVSYRGTTIAFTVSVGVAALSSGQDLEQAVDQADSALYRAKLDGRDRVMVA
jgi:diguanylate cyclase